MVFAMGIVEREVAKGSIYDFDYDIFITIVVAVEFMNMLNAVPSLKTRYQGRSNVTV